jgi:hypothetical protein
MMEFITLLCIIIGAWFLVIFAIKLVIILTALLIFSLADAYDNYRRKTRS